MNSGNELRFIRFEHVQYLSNDPRLSQLAPLVHPSACNIVSKPSSWKNDVERRSIDPKKTTTTRADGVSFLYLRFVLGFLRELSVQE